MTPLHLATSNTDKVTEYTRLLGCPVTAVSLPIAELQPSKEQLRLMRQGRTSFPLVAADIAGHKARAAYQLNGNRSVIIEDTCLFIEALEGLPGPLIAAFSSPVALKMLCQAVASPAPEAIQTKLAVAIVTLSVWGGGVEEPQHRQGIIEGAISSHLRGEFGFGWDPIFIPSGSDKTFAEMLPEEKDSYSMRKLAALELRERPFKVPQSAE